jgi:L-asparaginase
MLTDLGNGDSFLRLSAASTVASLVKFGTPRRSLQAATSWMAGPEGQLQRSAGPRWGGSMGEGEGGLIGIEFVEGKGKIVWGFNRAMFRAWVDEEGVHRIRVFEGDY